MCFVLQFTFRIYDYDAFLVVSLMLLLFCQDETRIKCVANQLDVTSISELVLDYFKRFGFNIKHQSMQTKDCR